MKFKTAHKNFITTEKGGKKATYRAHRDGNKVWVTSGEKGATIMDHVFNTVAQAGAWMKSPSIKIG